MGATYIGVHRARMEGRREPGGTVPVLLFSFRFPPLSCPFLLSFSSSSRTLSFFRSDCVGCQRSNRTLQPSPESSYPPGRNLPPGERSCESEPRYYPSLIYYPYPRLFFRCGGEAFSIASLFWFQEQRPTRPTAEVATPAPCTLRRPAYRLLGSHAQQQGT